MRTHTHGMPCLATCYQWQQAGGGPHTWAAPRITSRIPKPQPLEPDCRSLASGLQVKRLLARKKKKNNSIPLVVCQHFICQKSGRKQREEMGKKKKLHLTELSHKLWLVSHDISAILKPWQIKIQPASTGFGSAILFITGCNRTIHISYIII